MSVSERVADPEAALKAGRVPCPDCAGPLRPWGHAERRFVRELGTSGRWWRPRRAWCATCSVTHVLLPASLVARRRDSAQVIGTALLAMADGAGHRSIAEQLGRPASTVRGWLRRFASNAERLRVRATALTAELNPLGRPSRPAGSSTADAVEALASLSRAVALRMGPTRAVWAEINLLAGGLLR